MGPYIVRADANNSMDAAGLYWVDTTATASTFDLTQEKFAAAPSVTTGMSGFVTLIPTEEAIRNSFRLSTDPTALEANVVNITSQGTGPHVFGTVADEEVVLRTPWSIDEVWELDFTQDESTLYLFHKDHHPYELRRFNTSSFRLVPLEITIGPFGDVSPAGTGSEAVINTAIASANDFFPIVEVELTGGYFKGTHVGTSFRKGYGSSSTRTLNKSIIGTVERLTDHYMHFLQLTNAFFDQPSSNQITITSHPFATDEPVCIVQGDGTMADELEERVVYYIRDIGANTIELADAPGGGTKTLTPGSGTDHQIVSLWLVSEDEDGASASHPFASTGEKCGSLFSLGELPEGFEPGRSYNVDYVSSTVVTLSDEDGNLVPVSSAGDGRFFLSAGENAVKADMRVTVDPRAENVYSSTVVGSTVEWYDSVWNGKNGWPAKGAFHQQRMICGNSADYPETVWASAVGDPTDFSFDSRSGSEAEDYDRSVVDSSGFSYRLLGGQTGAIQWMSGAQALLVGAESAIATLAASTNREAVTPTSVNAEIRQRSGVSATTPVDALGDLVFEAKARKALQAAVFDGASGTFAIDDITLIADHVGNVPTKQLAWQADPYGIVYAVRTDGTLFASTYSSRQGLAAWHRMVLGGTDVVVESAACIPATDDHGEEYEALWLVVTRTIGGSTVRFVEYLDSPFRPDHDDDSAYFVDAGIVYDSTSTATISGLSHLNGETVRVWADGAAQSDEVVSGGSITIDTAASTVSVGLGFDSIWESMPFETAVEQATTIQGLRSRLVDGQMRVYRSVGGQLGPRLAKLYDIDYRRPGHAMDTPIPLFTGLIGFPSGAGYGNEATLALKVDTASPFHLVAITARIEWVERS